MSNLLNYLTIGKRLGESVTLQYNGDLFTSSLDGSVWKANNGQPLAYSSTYSQLLTEAPSLITSAVQLNGPYGSNLWENFIPKVIAGANTGGATWVTVRSSGSTFDTYYTSTDAGASWTSRTLPATGKTWGALLWDGTNFILYANNTGANGVYESTDGINWTARTAISITTVVDLIYNGSVYLAWPANGGTTAATSTDRVTWTTRTITASQGTPSQNIIGGVVTWNAGASLFIANTTTNGTYQTSPDGATWTTRTGLSSFSAFMSGNAVFFASNSTTTVAATQGGSIATSTNGTTWTLRSLGSFNLNYNNALSAIYWDGTYFIIIVNGLLFYSADGITWTRSTRGSPGTGASSYFKVPSGTGFLQLQYGYVVTDPSSTSNTNIVPSAGGADTGTMGYTRIL